MRQAIVADLTANNHRIGARIAGTKQGFDLALLAAECCLGMFDTLPQIGVTEQWLDQLVSTATPEQKEMATFWSEQLRPAVARNEALDLDVIAQRLEALTTGKTVRAPRIQVEPSSPQQTNARPTSNATAAVPPPTPSEFENEWQALAPTTKALRRDMLGKAALKEYKTQLHALATKYPQRAEVWNELLLVLISYESDATEALRVADEATKHLPANAELQRTREMVKMWAIG